MLGRAHPSFPLPLLSALHDWHLANRAVFGTFAGRELVAHYGSGENEQADLKRLGLVDMSLWPRRGYRGPGVADWLGAAAGCGQRGAADRRG
jgi:glycine cleavage system aminomethyltransferase T